MNDPEPPGAIELLAACLDDGICVLGEHSCIVPEVGCGSSAARLLKTTVEHVTGKMASAGHLLSSCQTFQPRGEKRRTPSSS